jgi:anti-anti-sigma regulatory factor
MRASGLVDHVRGLGAHDHVCWQYDTPDDFRARVAEFLVDGLAEGYRVWYTAAGDVRELTEELREIDGVDQALRSGAAQVVSLDDTYAVGAVVRPGDQVARYALATDQAVADGFAGLRVAAEATPLVVTAEQLDAFARYEHQIDRYMADRPFSALCGYDRTRLGDAAIAQLACLHPNTNAAVDFRLHSVSGAVPALAGELDLFSDDLFAVALERAHLEAVGGQVVLDGTRLTFVDHAGLVRLSRHAADLGVDVVLRTSWPGAPRLAELLGLPGVRVEAA